MRIIAGIYRGRRLIAPAGLETRPTSDRVREAVFSSLGPLIGATVLDLYAGTGALGIESLSRGAERVVFVEEARAALTALRTNLETLDLKAKTKVLAIPVARAPGPAGKEGPYHLLFADPPYADLGEVPTVVEALIAAGGIVPGGRVVVEHARKDPPPPIAGLALRSTRRYGTTAISYYVHGALPA
ncbi:MAG: 16S rRNA (guanine(966)-N(2))-methyltransferase RsmD [Minicystis sp.]